MRTADLLSYAFDYLRADRRQTVLACLGIVCGIAAVVTALAIGEGARREALATVDALGIDTVVLDSSAMLLTGTDVREIERAIPDAAAVAPVRTGPVRVLTPAVTLQAKAFGVTMAWSQALPVTLARGRWLTAVDVSSHRRVAVLGAALARRILPDRDPVGAAIRLASDWYVVVGTLALPSPQDAVFIPLGALDSRLSPYDGPDRLSRIVVSIRPPGDPAVAATRIERLVRRTRPADSVQVIVPRELLAARMRARRTLDALLLSTGTVVLAISGLGIMNIMLAGIARRVSEIGIRRAVGARRRDVVAQFASESVVVCSVGGVVGLPIGVAVTATVGRLAGWATTISIIDLASALTMAAAAGLAFGIYPAVVASRWTPCEALRNG